MYSSDSSNDFMASGDESSFSLISLLAIQSGTGPCTSRNFLKWRIEKAVASIGCKRLHLKKNHYKNYFVEAW